MNMGIIVAICIGFGSAPVSTDIFTSLLNMESLLFMYSCYHCLHISSLLLFSMLAVSSSSVVMDRLGLNRSYMYSL